MTGHVYWITGLSGAGKSTTAHRLTAKLREYHKQVILLDGDDLRAVYGDGLAFALDDRRVLAMRHARLCRLLSLQGFDVVCATISLFHACHDWCRQNIAHYHEIYLRTSWDELRRRDPKGLYQQASGGETADVAGVNIPVEEPRRPDLIIDNDGRMTPEDVVQHVWEYVLQQEGQTSRAS